MVVVGQQIVIQAKSKNGVDRSGTVLERSRDRDGVWWLRVNLDMKDVVGYPIAWVREETVIDRELYVAQDVIRESNYGDF